MSLSDGTPETNLVNVEMRSRLAATPDGDGVGANPASALVYDVPYLSAAERGNRSGMSATT